MRDPAKTNVMRRSKWQRPGTLAVLLLVLTVAGVVYAFSQFYIVGAPDRPGWSQRVAEFERAVAVMPPAPADEQRITFDVSASLSEYGIRSAVRLRSGAFFYDETGCHLFDQAGIAYFPDGPDPSLQETHEKPEYKSLGGPWYSFCATAW